MELLTKEERHIAYIILLEEADDHFVFFEGAWLCYLIYDTFGIHNNGFDNSAKKAHLIGSVITYYFPELLAKKPKSGWPSHDASGLQIRKKWLQECIKETA